MKCPKCGYLGFEAVDRCRNCGYDFSLHAVLSTPELPIREEPTEVPLGATDFSLPGSANTGAPASVSFTPDLQRALGTQPAQAPSADLPLFGAGDDAPLISGNRPPRPPLAVRRATPEIPRVRTAEPRAPLLDLTPPDAASLRAQSGVSRTHADLSQERYAADVEGTLDADAQPASVGARLAAAVIDILILLIIDAAVVYFTLQICGLALDEAALLPKVPLIAFLLLQNGGYVVAFTAGGQTLGKMAAGIRVVPVEPHASLGIEQSLVRTIAWTILAAPAGLGFVTALFSGERRGLHDRLARTKVVRASA